MVDMTRPSFGDKSSEGAYDDVIPTFSQIHILDFEIIILVLPVRTRFMH